MTRYRRRPDEVDAFMVTDDNVGNPASWPDWARAAFRAAPDAVNQIVRFPGRGVEIYAEGGMHYARCGDYVVRDAAGRLSALPPDVFEARYEPVETSSPENGND
ncbi:MAG TPA: hypothetical protein VGW34_03270 [Allosphingosinicella sp.]|nr:hypothetical protein [Allosphingosinicella sp.]